MQNNFKWKSHVQDIVTKASKKMYFVRACRKANLPRNTRLTCNLLHKNNAHSGIRGTNLGSLTTLYLKEDNRKSTKSMSRHFIGLPRNTIEALESRHAKNIVTYRIQKITHVKDLFLELTDINIT